MEVITRAIWGNGNSRKQNGSAATQQEPVSGVVGNTDSNDPTKPYDAGNDENANVADVTDSQRGSNPDREHGSSTDTQGTIQKEHKFPSSANTCPRDSNEADPTAAVDSNRDVDSNDDPSTTTEQYTPSTNDSTPLNPNTTSTPSTSAPSSSKAADTTPRDDITASAEPALTSSDDNNLAGSQQSADRPSEALTDDAEQTQAVSDTKKGDEDAAAADGPASTSGDDKNLAQSQQNADHPSEALTDDAEQTQAVRDTKQEDEDAAAADGPAPTSSDDNNLAQSQQSADRPSEALTHDAEQTQVVGDTKQEDEDAAATAAADGPAPTDEEQQPSEPAPQNTQQNDASRGAGQKYIRSTGVAAEGGDFDATRPGAGIEADRLLEEAGIHHGPGNPAPPGDPSMTKKGLSERLKEKLHHGNHGSGGADSSGDNASEKKGLGERVKEKMHLGKH